MEEIRSEVLEWEGAPCHLSPKVKELVSVFNEGSIKSSESEFIDDDWCSLLTYLGTCEQRDHEWYRLGSMAFSWFCSDHKKTEPDWGEAESWRWLSHPDLFTRCELTDEVLQGLCTLCCGLERSLQDLFAVLSPKQQVPSLLRDLVLSDTIKSFLDAELSILLEIVFGGPKSMNLRNLAWHGFLRRGDIDPKCLKGLVSLAKRIGNSVTERQLRIVHRPLRTATKLTYFQMSPAEPNSLFAISNGKIHPYGDVLADCRNQYLCGNYFGALCLALPLLECLMRREFVAVNVCLARVLTAEDDALYTTMTEMLAPQLEDCVSPNCLVLLRPRLTEIMLDVFAMPEGPRIRDRVSHGEVASGVEHDEGLQSWCQMVAVLISWLVEDEESPFCNSIRSIRPIFHPSALLCVETIEASARCKTLLLQKYSFLDRLEVDEDELQGKLAATSDKLKIEATFDFDPIVLHRPQSELASVSQMRKIVRCVTKFCREHETLAVSKEKLMAENKLSWRQERSFRKMISCKPVICQFLVNTLILVSKALNDFRSDSYSQDRTVDLRRILVSLEKLCSCVAPEKNDWEKAEAIAADKNFDF